jgi:hypothetical protein
VVSSVLASFVPILMDAFDYCLSPSQHPDGTDSTLYKTDYANVLLHINAKFFNPLLIVPSKAMKPDKNAGLDHYPGL